MANRIDVTAYSMPVRKYLRNAGQLLACIAIGSAITGCNAFGEQKLEGTVWDKATWKPIEGVMVVATYSKLADGFFVTNFASVCHKSAMVMTGLDGKFEFPRDWKYGLPNVVAFKPMYVVSSMPRELPPGARKTVPVLREARETDPVLKFNPYKSAMEYPRFKEPAKVRESAEKGTQREDYPAGITETLVHDPFGGCTSDRIVAARKDRQAWIDLLKAEVKEMERLGYPQQLIDSKRGPTETEKKEAKRLDYPKYMIEGLPGTILSLENSPDPKN